jgi:AraC family transcriptional regulator
MLYHAFPDLQWLKQQAESRFAGRRAWGGEMMPEKGWPNVVLNVKSGSTLRDNIPGPLSLFSNVSGESRVVVDGRTTTVGEDHFFISNNSQRYTLEIARNKSAETFNIHFGESWMESVLAGIHTGCREALEQQATTPVEFYNKLYHKDEVVKTLQQQLALPGKTRLEREELMVQLIVHMLTINRGEKEKADHIKAARLSTRVEILRRLHLATDHIYQNYHTDVSLEELSKVSMLSKFHFLRAFQQAFGSSPHKVLNNVRIEKAKGLLLRSDLDVAEVGKTIGVRDSSSFSRMFRKETGIYPTVFRGNMRT